MALPNELTFEETQTWPITASREGSCTMPRKGRGVDGG